MPILVAKPIRKNLSISFNVYKDKELVAKIRQTTNRGGQSTFKISGLDIQGNFANLKAAMDTITEFLQEF